MACFDKTGTLTEDGLDVLGVRSVDRSAKRFAELEEDIENVPIIGAADAKMPLLHALATCHGLKLVNGEVIGDPLDLRMFEFTRWTLEEGKEGTSKPKADVGKHKGGKGKSGGAPRETTKPNVLTKIPERAPTLVQTIVRPPGGVEFKLEDALKAGRKVNLRATFMALARSDESLPPTGRTLSRTWCDTDLRLRVVVAKDERTRQEAQIADG